jgi:hypothetical protein
VKGARPAQAGFIVGTNSGNQMEVIEAVGLNFGNQRRTNVKGKSALRRPSEDPRDIAWEAIVILHASNGFSSDQPAVRQLHVQPAFGLALISAMAVSSAAFVFVSFGALVWHLLH